MAKNGPRGYPHVILQCQDLIDHIMSESLRMKITGDAKTTILHSQTILPSRQKSLMYSINGLC